MSEADTAKAAGTFLFLLLPFVAWSFHGIGKLIDKRLGRPAVNGASIYNWLTLAILFVVAVAGGPESFGRLIAMFSVSWIVAFALSKSYRRRAAATDSAPT